VKEGLGVCPLCGKPVAEGKKSYYCAGYKQEPPCSFLVWKEVGGAKVSAALVLDKEGKAVFSFPEKKPRRPAAGKTGKGQ
jgi:DNA topoisomerase-3